MERIRGATVVMRPANVSPFDTPIGCGPIEVQRSVVMASLGRGDRSIEPRHDCIALDSASCGAGFDEG